MSPFVTVGASTLMLAWLVVGVPWLGFHNYRRLKEALARGEPDIRVRFYRRMVARQSALALAALAFERSMRSPYPDAIVLDGAIVTVLFLALLFVPIAIPRVRARMVEAARQIPNSLLPLTIAERRMFVLISVGAGVSEELAYRGFFFHIVHPFLPVTGALLLSSIAFGIGHLFQGPKGVFATGVLGVLLGAIYATTGSLWPAILVHVGLDLRFVFLDLRTVSDGGASPEVRGR